MPGVAPFRVRALVLLCAVLLLSDLRLGGQEPFRFRSGVELINVTATVSDRSGRFVPQLKQSDFTVYDDNQPVDITHFSAERVPVSLGLVLDTSGSMAGEKLEHALAAVERFLDRLDSEDEVFVYGFSNETELIQDWTTNRGAVSASLRRVRASGGTAMYDAVIEAVPIAHSGRNRKKALIVISDGNDSNSRADVRDVRQAVRETEVLVYAIGIDGQGEPTFVPRQPTFPRAPMPPIPFPGRGRGRPRPPWSVPPPSAFAVAQYGASDRVNVLALREMTDDSGGRTEIVRQVTDLDRATAGIADELSQQYYIGYPSPARRDGRWHTIRVEVRDPSLRVRARRGYLATS
jgi:Ca-activated chloride channel homolog